MKKAKGKDKSTNDQGKSYQKPKKQVERTRYIDLLGLVGIIVLGIIIYSNSFGCSFHFDDSFNIVDNPKIRDLSDISAIWNYGQRRFVAFYTFALNYHFGALNVWGYHFVNILIHLINTCLVWWLTLLIFSSSVLKDNPISKHKYSIAFFTALLFVSHPLATQSITYIIQRLASLVTLFYLLSVILYAKARLFNRNNTTKYLLYAGSFISACLAMFTKENAITLPFAILLFEICFVQKRNLNINFKNYKIILLVVASISLFIFLILKIFPSVFSPIPPTMGNTFTITPLNYLFTQFSVIIKYIQLLILPVHQNLDYDFPLSTHFFELRTLISFVLIIALVISAIWLFNKNRIISFGIGWFFITLAVESSFLPLTDLIFEHRTYLPSFGFFLIVSSGLFMLLWEKYKSIAICVLLLIAGTNSILTYNRNKVWKDDLTLWTDVVSKSPHKARPVATRGDCYRNIGQPDKAITDYTTAIQINPRYSTAYHNRGGVFGTQDKWDKALADYSEAIKIDPAYKQALYNRGNIYAKFGQTDKAIDDYTAAIKSDPNFTFAYYARSIAYSRLKDWDKALADCNKAVETDPKYAPTIANRGLIYFNLEQWDKAITDYTLAIEMDPNYATSYSNRGVAYDKLGQWDKAIADYSKAIEIDPNNANNYYNRGVAFGNLGQWNQAIENYSKAIELDPNKTSAYTNRDLAYGKLKSDKK